MTLFSCKSILFIFVAIGICHNVAAAEPAARVDQTGRDYSGQKLGGRDFKDYILKDAKFIGSDLTDARLAGADLRGADFTSAQLEKADISGADLRGAKLDAHFIGAKFDKANLDEQTLILPPASRKYDGTILPRPDMAGATLQSGNLSFNEASLRKVKFYGNIEGVDFRKADLRGADFSEATNAELAMFKGAIYDQLTRWTIDPVAKKAIFKENANAFLLGSWLINVEKNGATEMGLLDLNDDKTFRWLANEKDPSSKGSWRAATPAEEKALGSSGIILEKGEGGLDWLASKKTMPDGNLQLSLQSLTGNKSRSAKLQAK